MSVSFFINRVSPNSLNSKSDTQFYFHKMGIQTVISLFCWRLIRSLPASSHKLTNSLGSDSRSYNSPYSLIRTFSNLPWPFAPSLDASPHPIHFCNSIPAATSALSVACLGHPRPDSSRSQTEPEYCASQRL